MENESSVLGIMVSGGRFDPSADELSSLDIKINELNNRAIHDPMYGKNDILYTLEQLKQSSPYHFVNDDESELDMYKDTLFLNEFNENQNTNTNTANINNVDIKEPTKISKSEFVDIFKKLF